jgi:hypothetical protein
MRPGGPTSNRSDRVTVYSKSARDGFRSASPDSMLVESPDFTDLLLREFGKVIFLTSTLSSFANHVFGIFLRRPFEKMFQVVARRVVASVEDLLVTGIAFVNREGYSVDVACFPREFDGSVLVVETATWPSQTLVRIAVGFDGFEEVKEIARMRLHVASSDDAICFGLLPFARQRAFLILA